MAICNSWLMMRCEQAELVTQPQRKQALLTTVSEQYIELINGVWSSDMDDKQEVASSLRQNLQKSMVFLHTVQYENLDQELTQTGNALKVIKNNNQALLDSKEVLLGRSLAESNYHRYTKERKIFGLAQTLFELGMTALTWTSLLTTVLAGSGALQVLLVAAGWAGAVGSSATGIGLAVFAGLAAVSFAYNLGVEVWGHRRQFKQIPENDPMLLKGVKVASILVKCTGLAIVKTLLTDMIAKRVIAKAQRFLAWSPLKRLFTSLSNRWPSSEALKDDNRLLNKLITDVERLKTDIKARLETLKTQPGQAISPLDCNDFRKKLSDYQTQVIRVARQGGDARYLEPSMRDKLKHLTRSCETMDKQLKRMEAFEDTQKKFDTLALGVEEDSLSGLALESSLEGSTLVTSNEPHRDLIGDYREAMKQKQSAYANEQGFKPISRFWTWLRGKPKPAPAPYDPGSSFCMVSDEAYSSLDSISASQLNSWVNVSDSEILSEIPRVNQMLPINLELIDSYCADPYDTAVKQKGGRVAQSEESFLDLGRNPNTFLNSSVRNSQEEEKESQCDMVMDGSFVVVYL